MKDARSNRPDAATAALKLIVVRPRSVMEIRNRLASKEYAPEEVDSAIAYLEETGYLDDERYAAMLSENRMRIKRWGPGKIRADLASKGVAPKTIDRVVRGIDDAQEASVAGEAFLRWCKKYSASPPLDKLKYAKAFRHLNGRGFSAPVIMKLLKDYKNGD